MNKVVKFVDTLDVIQSIPQKKKRLHFFGVQYIAFTYKNLDTRHK